MSTGARKLRLGPLPKTETIKMTIGVSVELKAMLDRYAELHTQAWGEAVDAATLVPHMLVTFMQRDRGFRSRWRGSDPQQSDGHGETASGTGKPDPG